MKQVFFDKGNRGEGGGTTSEAWEKFYEFDGTKLRALPLPSMTVAQREGRLLARAVCWSWPNRLSPWLLSPRSLTMLHPATSIGELIDQRVVDYGEILSRLRREQESLDWWVYSLSDLASPDAAESVSDVRTSDWLFARAVVDGEVGRRYFELCRLPTPEALLSRAAPPAEKLDAISKSKELQIIEVPKYKRTFREGFRGIDSKTQARDWLLSRAERVFGGAVQARTPAGVATALLSDPDASKVMSWLSERRRHWSRRPCWARPCHLWPQSVSQHQA